MPSARLKRNDLLVERPSTKAHLINVAEELIGLYGLDGISLREIAASSGQSNANAVQYHFGDKLGLIRAILKDRMLRRETLRHELLAKLLEEKKQSSPRDLLAAMMLPALAFKNERSGHVFCRFLLQCYIHPDSGYDNTENLYQEFQKQKESSDDEHQLAIVRLTALMQQCLKQLPPTELMRRLHAVHLMFVASVVEFDNAQKAGKKGGKFDSEFILNLAVAALTAPYVKPKKQRV